MNASARARLHISALPRASLQTKRPLLRKALFSSVFILVNARARLHISALPRASLQTKKAFAPQGLLIVRRQPYVRKRTTASCKQLRRHFSCRLFVCGEGEIRTRGRVTPSFFQCVKYNYLIVSILILHFIVNFYLFCPDFVPVQNNKNN